ncbi:hypothetical protein BGZ83_007478 [Gryganskiella cystojenkinii]|nr:hypothetical protein BGZ83_007478 [Gryganskiella cystojenkinii]
MATHTQRRPGGKDEPDDLRKLRQDHRADLATLKELFADWTDEDLLYAIQDAGGDIELAIVRISDGLVTQWGEVKGKKKTPKPKSTTFDRHDSRFGSQRGGHSDRGSRGRGDGFRGGRGGSTRGAHRGQNGDRHAARSNRDDAHHTISSTEATSGGDWPSVSGVSGGGDWPSEAVEEETPSWADAAAAADSTTETASGWGPKSTTSSVTNSHKTTSNHAAASSVPASTAATEGSSGHSTHSTTNDTGSDSWDTHTNGSTPAPVAAPRKINTATIPAGSKMSWAKIVKPEPAPEPKPAPIAAPKTIPAPAAKHAKHVQSSKPAHKVEEHTAPADNKPISEPKAVEQEPGIKAPEVTVPAHVEHHKTAASTVPEPAVHAPESVHAPAPPPAGTHATSSASSGPPGLKQKPASHPKRLNQEAPVVLPGGPSMQSIGLKFGSFSLNDDAESEETRTATTTHTEKATTPVPAPASVQSTQSATLSASHPTQQTHSTQHSQTTRTPTQPQHQQQHAQSATQTQPQTHHQPSYGRQDSPVAPIAAAPGLPGPTPTSTGLSPAPSNATSYLKQDPTAASHGGHHHLYPGMGHDAMGGSPYGNYMPTANQLGSFGMGPMASLPNDYAALYGHDIGRGMYYDPTSYGQVHVSGANSYQTRDSGYVQDASTTSVTSSTGATASSTATTQAQQTLQQQQQQHLQQQGGYPGVGGGAPYYPYYYMAPNQFPNAYQQSGYSQQYAKNMYPMYQQQQHQQQQSTHSAKPGGAGAGASASTSNNTNSAYGGSNYGGSTGTGQGTHNQYSQSGYDDMSGAGAGLHSLSNDPYAKYGNPSYLGQQPGAGVASTGVASTGTKGGAAGPGGAAAGGQSSSVTGVQQQQPGQGGQPGGGYYMQHQQMFSSYQQYPSHGYHPSQQHQGHHQGAGSRNNSSNQHQQQQQFWSQN